MDDTLAVDVNFVALKRNPRILRECSRKRTNPVLTTHDPLKCIMPIPDEIRGQKYISLVTFRKSGVPVRTPVWFAEANDKIYLMTRNDSGKYKRIRNTPEVRVAPCTMRGRVTGPEFAASARILPREAWPTAQAAVRQKYLLARIPFFWSKRNEYIEIVMAD